MTELTAELTRAETHAFLMTTRTQGWGVVNKVLAKLVQDRVDLALDSIDDTGARTQRAGGARDLVREFNKIVAGLSDQLTSETASD
jgi:hypothetical protein